ncbi:bifunctional metallophosphatase/5'-nucleotidase [Alteriqipengyuania lutimaris]|uniref:Bifunctional metallophosphatase/5'-nucleotidase n=1 Tax=Alteriqipengyuania lutimaris TaxID=1538146 RepID=A0A395LQJ7_9SPHN|nr:bifunctional metallophosphatase/5'-nucleotidase [Alteriqipengyuania lutimaris]MBB3034119.1 5'-nucleotidase [Alteriqipengyuania lutimaris]RDS76950.1 bifunctional metallophosphatase/5'-nucleotidase [Alteriqipengyuania lutimaris]
MIARKTLAALLALSLGACATVPATQQPAPEPEPVTIGIVGLNDFHGNLKPIARPVKLGDGLEVQAGGAAYLAAAVDAVRAKHDNTMVIAAGDLIGASPLVSSLFLDEPTIGAMNRIGLDFNAVGNHEFDRGWRELQRVQDGGCEKLTLREPCAVEPDFAGADFAFLAANVAMEGGGTLFPAYGIKTFETPAGEIRIGVIGLTLKETPTLVTPSGVDGLTFGDEAAAINRTVPLLEEQGADAILVAIHQGLYTDVGFNDKSCGGVSGPLIGILEQVDPRVDLVLSGHTHAAYVCDFAQIDPSRSFLVTSAGYGGSLLTDIAVSFDPVTHDVVGITADNVVVQSAAPEDANPDFAALIPRSDLIEYVARYADAASAAERRPVGRILGNGAAPGPATEETQLGNLIADAQLFATREEGAQIAFMNNSGIRGAGLEPAQDGAITFGQIYSVQPFGNTLVTKTFSGRQLLALLEQQFDGEGFVQTFSVSEGFAMTYDLSEPVGSRVVSATLDGDPIDPEAAYRITMNSFLAAGGDSFTIFEDGTDVVAGPVDLDAMEAFLARAAVTTLPATGRITAVE